MAFQVRGSTEEARIKHEVEMEVEVELEEEEEDEARPVIPNSPPPLEVAEGQLSPDQLVYDFTGADYLLPFEDLKFYMDQEERLLPPPSELQQTAAAAAPPPSDGDTGGYDLIHDYNVVNPQLVMVAQPQRPPGDSSMFGWSPPAHTPPQLLQRYDDLSLSSFNHKDGAAAANNDSDTRTRLTELEPPSGVRMAGSCPSCHCDLSCTAVVSFPSAGQPSCDSFLNFPEHSLDIEKFL
jgi:hypothetical protein